MNLGWQRFGSFVRSGTGLDDVPDEQLDKARRQFAKDLLVGYE